MLFARDIDRDWSAEEVSSELRSEPNLIARALGDLSLAGLLVQVLPGQRPLTSRYCFQPRDAGLSQAVVALNTQYRERRYAVLDAIYSRPSEIEPPAFAVTDASADPPPPSPDTSSGTGGRPVSGLRAFSDAFRLRREER